MDTFIPAVIALAVVYWTGKLIWRLRRPIMAILVFAGCFVVLLAWAVTQDAVPELGVAAAVVGAFIGARRFTRTQMGRH